MIAALKGIIGSERMLGRLFRGGAILGFGTGIEFGMRFCRNMILTRLLAPEAFGLMAIVMSVASLFQVLTGLGIKESIVQNPRGTERPYLNGAWWLATLRGAGLYLAVFIAAPWIAHFYDAPELKPMLRVAFICVLAQSALSSRAYVAVKEMRYPRWAIIQNGGGAIGTLTAIALGFYLRGVWALVLGYATEGIARCVLSFIICPFLPGLHFEKHHLKELIRFTKGIFGLPLLVLIYVDAGVFTVGKLCSKRELGILAMALALAKLPRMASSVLVDLFIPAFSKLQHDPRSINKALLRITTISVLLTVPILFLIVAYGREILTVAFGSKYASGYWLLVFLFANEAVALCNVPLASVFIGIGKPDLLRRSALIRALLVLIFIIPATLKLGALGGAIVPLFAMTVAYVFQLLYMRRVTALELGAFQIMMVKGLVFAMPVAVTWLWGDLLPTLPNPIADLLVRLVICLVLYAVVGLLFWQNKILRSFFWSSFQREVGQ